MAATEDLSISSKLSEESDVSKRLNKIIENRLDLDRVSRTDELS